MILTSWGRVVAKRMHRLQFVVRHLPRASGVYVCRFRSLMPE